MDINLQYFGGRGSSSGIGGGWSNTTPSEKQARFMYNGAKRKTGGEDGYIKNSKMENKLHDIDSGKLTGEQFAKQFTTREELDKAGNYLMDKSTAINHKIRSLKSADELRKNPKLYNEAKATREASNALNERRKEVAPVKAEKTVRKADDEYTSSRTSTYDRWYKKNRDNFASWYFGSNGKPK